MLIAGGFAGTAAQADETEPTPVVAEAPADEIAGVETEVSPLAAGGCTLGWGCVWRNSNYGGAWAASDYNSFLRLSSDEAGVAKTVSNSAWANGNLCHATSFRTGSMDSHHYFILDSQTRRVTNFKDATLSNGAGRGPWAGENWQNRVRYLRFFDGPNCT
ncbi:hypothetical protein VR010_14505 [Actinomycetaceae bacterium L2_0104]